MHTIDYTLDMHYDSASKWYLYKNGKVVTWFGCINDAKREMNKLNITT